MAKEKILHKGSLREGLHGRSQSLVHTSKNVPFLQTPLLELFGETGFQSYAFDQVLKGMLEIPSTCNHMQEKN